MTTHCMIDLETLGNTSTAAIIAIGWCIFDEERLIESGQRHVNFESAMQHGDASPDTLRWWFGQSDAARQPYKQQEAYETLEYALRAFTESMKKHNPVHFWAHATFDFPILNHAFKATGLDNPIGFRQCRDLRTLDMLAKAETLTHWPEREGTHHDARDDAVHQSKCVQMMLKVLGWKG